MTEAGLEASKAKVRQAARARRAAAFDPAAAQALVARFPESLRGVSPVAGYWPIGSEIDPRPLMAALAAGGAALALPRMANRAGPAVFLRWRPDTALSADAFGALAPPPEAEAAAPRLLLVPLLAFDRSGRRLGQGGGHYDRILAALRPGVIAVGLAYAAQVLPEVPAGPLDQRLDWIVTEREAVRATP
ncbi:MAG: 5-formyltetrahydrofolate cyclo-ligase [Hyphomonadaceae bacterium]